MPRMASCFHSTRVWSCWREVILALIPETLFSIMDSVSRPVINPEMILDPLDP